MPARSWLSWSWRRPEIASVTGAGSHVSSTARRKAKLELGGTTLPGSPADFGKFIADETEKWTKVIRTANIKAE
jgi:hypothetical protein